MKYFKLTEFDSPDEPGSGSCMNEEILNMLDAVRKQFGKPIKINSGYRTIARNKKNRWCNKLFSFKRFSCRYFM